MARTTENGNGMRVWLWRSLLGLACTVSVVVGIAAANVWNDQSVMASAFTTHCEADKAHRQGVAKHEAEKWAAIEKRLDVIERKLDALGDAQAQTQTQVQIIRTILDRMEKGPS